MWIAAVVLSVVLFGLRLDLSRILGLGDGEALFFAYGFHPQPAYLSYPGLIGWLSRCFGPDASPQLIHVWTAAAATALPWFGVLAARACGARGSPTLRSYFALALLPELALSSSAFTPELPLALFWLAALACAGGALRHPPASFRSLLASLGAGIAAALCCLSKHGGWLLALSLVGVLLQRPEAARRRTLAPWAATFLFAILVTPLLRWWLGRGLGLRFDPLSWQQALGVLLRPLVAATPPFLFAGALVASDLLGSARQSPIDRLLRLNLLLPLAPLLALALCTGGDTGWLTPAYLTLAVQAARSPALPRRLLQSCVGFGAALAVLGWCWLRTDLPFLSANCWAAISRHGTRRATGTPGVRGGRCSNRSWRRLASARASSRWWWVPTGRYAPRRRSRFGATWRSVATAPCWTITTTGCRAIAGPTPKPSSWSPTRASRRRPPTRSMAVRSWRSTTRRSSASGAWCAI